MQFNYLIKTVYNIFSLHAGVFEQASKHFWGTIVTNIIDNVNNLDMAPIKTSPLSSNYSTTAVDTLIYMNRFLPPPLASLFWPHSLHFYPFLCFSSSSSFSSSSILFFIQIWTTISSPALYTCMMMNRKSLVMEIMTNSSITKMKKKSGLLKENKDCCWAYKFTEFKFDVSISH